MPTPTPINEEARLEALRRYHILDTERERQFDDLVWLAAEFCQTPIALVSLVDRHRLWFKGRYGVEVSETPRNDSFCANAILNAPQLLVVPDASKDERFADNPLVTGEQHVRFYAGAPLVTPDHYAVGTLCVIDTKPRHLEARQKEALSMLSRQVVGQMELRRRLIELDRASGELTAANAELEAFSQAISHDLRGPLRATTGFAELLRTRHAQGLDPRGVQLLAEIEGNGRRATEMLDAFLRLLRLKHQPLHPTQVDMRELVERVLHELTNAEWTERVAAASSAEGGVARAVGTPARLQIGLLPPAWGDEGLLRQVWVNLISNALKFSRERVPPVIEIGGREEEQRLVYFVRDNGIGFDMGEAEQLGTAFRRLHGGEIEGSGLGLSIVRRILLRHDGQFWAEGTPNQGATFYFALPKARAATQRAGPPNQSRQAA